MAKIRIVGDSSGYVELAAPNAAGNNTLELPSNATKLVGADASNSLNVTGIATFSGGIIGNVTGNVNATGLSTFTSGINVGTGASISSPATNVLTLGTNNSERVRVDSSGRLGIGSATPGFQVTVDQGTTDGNLFDLKNEEVRLLTGVWGTGATYPREITLNATRFDSGTSPALRLAGQGGIKFAVDLNTVRMEIDSSGRVTMPYQPAFMVRGDESTTKASGSKFSFTSSGGSSKCVFDRLGNWSDANDRFTAPVTGVYNFSFGIYRQSATTQYSSIAPRVNNSEISVGDTFIIFQSRTPADDTMHVGSFLLNLTAGDYVELFMRGGASTITIYAGHTFFGGYLVG